ncbi:NADH:ubiquinone oxidoreductase subunit NDUFA12 [Enterovirga rhinocerotis]|uniref:NADH:ubiquinone oxidoreductase subunit n=1 Tax=Enterovirga rhinocerotis TaxID=1339210 RepID=A0A4R7C9F3_9HYPH|nr:NADH:ubiquinone oxidoreductase subunit NDUFA12 [Enterovirga rhinocerotis]TDR94672.1 NADH:ubiquinone oxidoreductase subunit [Enterovirga rhinocerotis]
MKLIDFLTRTFTWWNGQTWGTYWYTRRRGERVGEDELGNVYYRATDHMIDPSMGPERRWVVYNGLADMSRVPPSWRGWLAHTHNVPPSEEQYTPREWEMAHLPNMTGTPEAYRPQGSPSASGRRPAATGDYVPWSPDEGAAGRAG